MLLIEASWQLSDILSSEVSTVSNLTNSTLGVRILLHTSGFFWTLTTLDTV